MYKLGTQVQTLITFTLAVPGVSPQEVYQCPITSHFQESCDGNNSTELNSCSGSVERPWQVVSGRASGVKNLCQITRADDDPLLRL